MSTLKIMHKTISHCAQNLHVDMHMYSTWMYSLSCFSKMAHFNNSHKSKIILSETAQTFYIHVA